MVTTTLAVATEDDELYTEGDAVMLTDNWNYTYAGAITYIDESVLELTNTDRNTKSFAINSIVSIKQLNNVNSDDSVNCA